MTDLATYTAELARLVHWRNAIIGYQQRRIENLTAAIADARLSIAAANEHFDTESVRLHREIETLTPPVTRNTSNTNLTPDAEWTEEDRLHFTRLLHRGRAR